MSISYNVLTVPDTAAFDKHINALKPRWLLYKDSLAYADLIGAKYPFISVVHRDYAQYTGDDDLSLKITPAAWLSTQRALGFHDVWRYCCNENGFNERTLKWLNEVIELNAQQMQPLKLVVGNFATGSYPPDGWEQPQAVKLLHYLDYNRAWLVLGLHEYFGAIPTSGMYGGYPSNANIASSPNDAPGSKGLNLIPMDKWPQDTRGITLWHCGRFRFILKTCDELSIPYPRIIITEHGADDLGDIKPWLETLQKTEPYKSIRGWRSLKNQWRDWYGDNIELTYYNMLTYLDAAVYAGSPVEAQLIFCWGDSGGWEQFQVDNAPELQRRLEMYAGTPPPFDYGIPAHRRIVLTNLAALNLRNTPGGTDIGDVTTGETALIWPNPVHNGLYDWYKIQRDSGSPVDGFVAKTSGVSFEGITEPPETPKKAIVVIKIPGLTIEQAQEILHNVSIQIDTGE